MLSLIENIDLIQDWLQMMIFTMLCTSWKCGVDLKKCYWLTDFRAKSRDPLGMKITLLNELLSGWRSDDGGTSEEEGPETPSSDRGLTPKRVLIFTSLTLLSLLSLTKYKNIDGTFNSQSRQWK